MFAFAGLVIGVPLLLIWFFLRRQAQASLRWPSAPGKVIDSRLVQIRDSDGQMNTEAAVTYTYAVGGASLQGNRVSIGSGNSRTVVQKYPAGTDVQVFYDPNKPTSAVLEPGGSGIKALPIVAIIVICAGIVLGVAQGPAAYTAAAELYKQAKFPEARAAFEPLAHSGSAEAKVYLGVMYAKGQGVPQDYVEAQKWFILAGEPGRKDREAMQKGLTPAQQQEAESKAAVWK